MPSDILSPADARAIRKLKSPEHIQAFLDEQIGYNHEETCYSPHLVLQHGKAHCMEGALLAAAVLRQLGFPPLLVDLEATADDDHVLAVYRQNGLWGAIAKSNYSGLRFRSAVYRSIRELALSYFEHYYNRKGLKSLRDYSRPINLTRFDNINWMSTGEQVWVIPEYLCEISHTPLLPKSTIVDLKKIDKRLFAAGRLGGSFH